MQDFNLDELVNLIGQLVTLLAVTGIIGVAMNPVVSYIKKIFKLNKPGNTTLKKAITLVVSAFGGILAVYQLGYFLYASLINVILTSFLVFVGATIFYNNFFKESKTIKKIEGKY